MGCAAGFSRIIIFILNVIFALAGLALLVIGILYITKTTDVTDKIQNEVAKIDGNFDFNQISNYSILVTVVGAVIFVISFFGCCGAFHKNSCMLTTYGVLMLIIFILQLALGIYIFVAIKQTNWEDELTKHLTEKFNDYQNNRNYTDNIQSTFKCCGVNGPSYWRPTSSIPNSCYEDKDKAKELYQDGCVKVLTDTVYFTMNVIGIPTLVIAIIELFAAVFGFCLSNTYRNESRRSGYA